MKGLIAATVLLGVLGIAGFLYRYTLETPTTPLAQTACTLEARICPDGSSVGRVGATCEFAACPLPNVELAQIGLSFVLPTGYSATGSTSPTRAATYQKNISNKTRKDVIAIERFVLGEDETVNDVMLANTQNGTSLERPQSMTEFAPVIIANRTFQSFVADSFEGTFHSYYYLPRERDVLRFEVYEHEIQDWTNPDLDISSLPEHAALLGMLATIQTN